MASEQGHPVVARFNSRAPLLDAKGDEALHGADVVIDFTSPELAMRHIKRYCTWNVRAVIGTTGWYGSINQVRAWLSESEAGLLYAPNFSLGVAIVSRLLERAATMMNDVPDYDAFVHEIHHKFKLDSPSGTALNLGQILIDRLDRKTHMETVAPEGAIDPHALHVSSTRTGHVVGLHTVGFDSPYDQIRLTHESKSRDGFAFGAIRAASWLQERHGLFTLDDMLDEWLSAPPRNT